MAEPTFLCLPDWFCPKRAKTVLRRAGVSTIIPLPRVARDPNGQNPLVKPIVACVPRPLSAVCDAQRPLLRSVAARDPPLGKPRELVGPGPTADELERILTIAARIPDHGKLHPWRFVTVADDQRDAFAALLREALPGRECGRDRRSPPEGRGIRSLCRAAGRAGLGASRRPQDPGVGAAIVVRRRRNEPAARGRMRSAMSPAG